MDKIKINNCPMCGSLAEEYYSGVIECYGHAWQTVGIQCRDDFNQHCDMAVSINADFYSLNYSMKNIV